MEVLNGERACDLRRMSHDEHLPAAVRDPRDQRRHLRLAHRLERLFGFLERPDRRWRIRLLASRNNDATSARRCTPRP